MKSNFSFKKSIDYQNCCRSSGEKQLKSKRFPKQKLTDLNPKSGLWKICMYLIVFVLYWVRKLFLCKIISGIQYSTFVDIILHWFFYESLNFLMIFISAQIIALEIAQNTSGLEAKGAVVDF